MAFLALYIYLNFISYTSDDLDKNLVLFLKFQINFNN
jgi:hypothetical protein